MSKNLGDAQNLLLKLEERNDVQAIDVSRMELANSKLQEDLKRREKALEESNQLFQAQASKHKAAVDQVNFAYNVFKKKKKKPDASHICKYSLKSFY